MHLTSGVEVEGAGGENASRIQMKEDGVQPTLCLESIRDIVLCK